MRSVAIALLVAGFALPAAADDKATARPNPPVLKEITSDFPDSEDVEYPLMTAKLEPGTFSPWHTHSAPVAVYVVSGVFTLEMKGRESVSLKPGEAMLEPVGVTMRAANNGAEPAEVVMFQVSEPDSPFLVPAE